MRKMIRFEENGLNLGVLEVKMAKKCLAINCFSESFDFQPEPLRPLQYLAPLQKNFLTFVYVW